MPNVSSVVFGECWLPVGSSVIETLCIEWTQGSTTRPPYGVLLKDLVMSSAACIRELVLLDAVANADNDASPELRLRLPRLAKLKLSGPPSSVRMLLDAITHPACTVVHVIANKNVDASSNLGAMALSSSKCSSKRSRRHPS